MIKPLENFNRARFEFYNRRMAVFGIRCGMAMNAMEDRFRQVLLDQMGQYAPTNTSVAHLLSRHEKTVRNLKRKYRNREQIVEKQNRMFLIGSWVHDETWRDPDHWISAERILNWYTSNHADDETFEEEVLENVLRMLVLEGTLIEKRLQYSVFYRSSQLAMNRCRVAETDEEALEIVAAITESFQESADSVTAHENALSHNKFSEWSASIVDADDVLEINSRLRNFVQGLIAEYEEKALNKPEHERVPLKVVSLVGCEVAQ